MKRLILWMLIACLLLSACGASTEETTEATPPPTEETVQYTEATQPPTEETTEPVTEPTEPAVDPATINPLTGETLEEPGNKRPYAVMINNVSEALPHLTGKITFGIVCCFAGDCETVFADIRL